MRLLRSMLYTSWLFVGTLLYAAAVLLVCWTPRRVLNALANSWANGQLRMLAWLCDLTYVVEGRENLPAGAHVSMWKHSSSWETIAQAALLPPQSWVLKRELMWIPVVGWAIRFFKPIAINRKAGTTAVNQVVEQGTQRLAEGLWILVFPEGTRVGAGEHRKYGVSGALLASRAGCKVVPVAHNAGEFWPRRGWLKKPGVIQVAFGPAIEAAGRDPRQVNEEVRAWIESKMAAMAASGPHPSRPVRVDPISSANSPTS